MRVASAVPCRALNAAALKRLMPWIKINIKYCWFSLFMIYFLFREGKCFVLATHMRLISNDKNIVHTACSVGMCTKINKSATLKSVELVFPFVRISTEISHGIHGRSKTWTSSSLSHKCGHLQWARQIHLSFFAQLIQWPLMEWRHSRRRQQTSTKN